jgi:ABC-type sugar transport system permease subunit/ABC-type glycerol-3-phosphate transport system substrate-binding protein
MQKSTNHLFSALMAWMVAAGFAVAGTATTEDPAVESVDGPASAGAITIEAPVVEAGEGMGFFQECARSYEKERPGVAINLYGDPRISDKVRVRILEGSFPEITNANLNYWNMIRSGDLLPLDEFLDQPNWEGDRTWRESFLPGSLDRYSYEGKVYGVPLAYFVQGFWYNKAMFEAHGWKAPATWGEFEALCEKIKAAGIAPIAFQGRYPGYAQMLQSVAYYQLAGRDRYYAQQNLEPGSFANPELETSFDLLQKTAARYFQEGSMGMSHTEAQMQFFLGNTATILCGAWLKSEMMGKIPDGFRLGFFNIPALPNPKGNPGDLFVFSSYYFVMTKAPHARESIDFLRFMTSRKMAGIFCRQRDIPVAIRGANEGNLSADMDELVTVINSARAAFGQAPGEGYPEMEQVWQDALAKLLATDVTPAELSQEMESTVAPIRDRAANPNHVTIRHVWKPVLLLGAMAAMVLVGLASAVRKLRAARAPGATAAAGRLKLGWHWVLVFVGPATLLYTVFVIVPSLKAFPWSLNQWDGLSAMQPVGLLNFKRLLFESDGFWVALGNNLFIMFVIPLFVLPLALFLAACISRGVRGSALFRMAFFFPNIVGGVAAALLWMHLYNPQGGVVNAALVALGLEQFRGFAWLSSEHLYWALVPMSVWGACGFNMILFLAAMESIPQDLYEAADIDGASHWRQFRLITLPLIWEVLCIAVVFMVIGGMKAFEIIWLLTNQAPTTQTHVIGTRMVQAMCTDFRIGEATAIAVLLFVMVFFGTVATLRLMKRETVEM